jgi:c-di-GMP-related signal transduction protein
MSKLSIKYLINLQNLRNKSFNENIQRLVDSLPVDQKPVQLVYNEAGELVDVRDYVKNMNEPKSNPIGFLQ